MRTIRDEFRTGFDPDPSIGGAEGLTVDNGRYSAVSGQAQYVESNLVHEPFHGPRSRLRDFSDSPSPYQLQGFVCRIAGLPFDETVVQSAIELGESMRQTFDFSLQL